MCPTLDVLIVGLIPGGIKPLGVPEPPCQNCVKFWKGGRMYEAHSGTTSRDNVQPSLWTWLFNMSSQFQQQTAKWSWKIYRHFVASFISLPQCGTPFTYSSWKHRVTWGMRYHPKSHILILPQAICWHLSATKSTNVYQTIMHHMVLNQSSLVYLRVWYLTPDPFSLMKCHCHSK
jgi:hypothetical protein